MRHGALSCEKIVSTVTIRTEDRSSDMGFEPGDEAVARRSGSTSARRAPVRSVKVKTGICPPTVRPGRAAGGAGNHANAAGRARHGEPGRVRGSPIRASPYATPAKNFSSASTIPFSSLAPAPMSAWRRLRRHRQTVVLSSSTSCQARHERRPLPTSCHAHLEQLLGPTNAPPAVPVAEGHPTGLASQSLQPRSLAPALQRRRGT